MIQAILKSKITVIMRKEFLHIVRDTRTLLITFALPVVVLILYGYALNFDIKNIPMVVRDLDNKPLTRDLIRKFESSRYFTVVKRTDSIDEENSYFLNDKAKMAVNFNPGFSADVISGKGAQLQIVVDGSDANTAVVAIGYINSILMDYSQGIIVKTFSAQGIKSSSSLFPIDAKPRVWYNEELKSVNFLIPGIISLVLMILAALITSLSIVSEKTRGTMEQLLSTSIKPYEIMFGKLLPYIAIGLGDVLLCVSVGVIVFKVPIRGSVLLLIIESMIFMFGTLSLGLLISTIAKKQEDAVLAGMLMTMLPSILLSGFVFPIESMPRIIQLITLFVPARYFLTILRGIFLKGVGLEYLWPDTLLLVLFGVLMITIASRRFKKKLE